MGTKTSVDYTAWSGKDNVACVKLSEVLDKLSDAKLNQGVNGLIAMFYRKAKALNLLPEPDRNYFLQLLYLKLKESTLFSNPDAGVFLHDALYSIYRPI